MEASELMIHIISSIRNIDGRISEISSLIREDKGLPKKTIEELRTRVKSLIETRMSLVYSMMDLRVPFMKWTKGADFDTTDPQKFYDSLMRHVA